MEKLSYFFRQLCAKELDRKLVEKLDEQAAELLCDLETIHPPGFFNPQQHLILPLAHEAKLGGLWRPVGSLRLREKIRRFVNNAAINARSRHP